MNRLKIAGSIKLSLNKPKDLQSCLFFEMHYTSKKHHQFFINIYAFNDVAITNQIR